MTNSLSYMERIEKAESLVFNKTKNGFLKNNSEQFKSLISGLSLSIEFFIKSYFKNNRFSRNKKTAITNKIKKFIDLAEIKTTNAFFHKKNHFKNIVGMECFIILL